MKNSTLFPYRVMEFLNEYLKISNGNYKSQTEQFDLKEIDNTITYCILKDYSEFRKIVLWERRYLNKLESQKETISERSFDIDKGPEDMIDNKVLKEYYTKCDGDIELIVQILGEEFLKGLSEEDQYRCGYIDYNQRRR